MTVTLNRIMWFLAILNIVCAVEYLTAGNGTQSIVNSVAALAACIAAMIPPNRVR